MLAGGGRSRGTGASFGSIGAMTGTLRRAAWLAGLAGLLWMAGAVPARAQLGSLLSPGRLAKAHEHLEGIANCTKCHAQGRRITADKCLACHTPIAERMARKMGVHRNVKDDCVTCHAEHAGVDGELRPFDQSGFDHAKVALFPLDGKHAPIASECSTCHKSRSFLTLSPGCATCHTDVHKGTLGQTCKNCHSPRTAFRILSGAFDHSRTRFALSGAHLTAACDKCHVNRVFKGLKFGTCTDCHREPHRGTFEPRCTSCHTTATWRTKKVDHSRTAYPLVGRHTMVACALCHKQPATQVKPRAATCATCHVDVHRGAFRQDCKSCHTEAGFAKAPFDHGTTAFSLAGRHAALTCKACHKSVVTAAVPVSKRSADFRGLRTACATCHADVHRGELGAQCETCHNATAFAVTAFEHPRFPEFFKGQHAPVACAKCHAPTEQITTMPAPAIRTSRARGSAAPASGIRRGTEPPAPSSWVLAARFKNSPTACVSCHKDVHLGQVGRECQICHGVTVPKFGVAGFSHAATTFPLSGRHDTVACVKCHKTESGAFPAGKGTAVRFRGVARECQGCHADVHLGQFVPTCRTCHSTATFRLAVYKHENRSWARVFVGSHARAECAACHKPITGEFPHGRGTAVRFKIDARCVACHTDVHRGVLGTNCLDCHRP